jgi:ribosomal protein S18 acetylase RimI-like enzyme
MLTYRSFRNYDPPALTSLWRSRAGKPGFVQPVSPDLFEQLVFAKLYFDYDGLVLAHDDGRLLGFAHAGFGPDPDKNWISTETGVICVVVTDPACAEAQVADGLLDRCEEYLRRHGVRTFFGGGLQPFHPFYVGLYGGSELPGVLDSDTAARTAMAARGYLEVERTVLLNRELNGFESQIDRQQMQIRRQMQVEVTVDAPTRNRWEALTVGEFDLTRFDLVVRGRREPVATALFRSMEPGGAGGVARAAGLIEIAVVETQRRHGLATFLLNEAFRQFLRQGIMRVAVQTAEANAAALGLFQKLGLQRTGQGGVWRKKELP